MNSPLSHRNGTPARKRTAASVPRREFLANTAAATAGAALTSSYPLAGQAAAEAQVQRYVPLGQTGMRVSDVSLGSSGLTNSEVLRRALDRGINYFDCAETYTGGDAERALGQVLPAVRDRVYITTKHKLRPGHSPADMMQRLEFSLRRLRTDYVDVHFNHAVNDVRRVANPDWHEFIDRAKQAGKMRFAGMSGHGSKLNESLDYVIDKSLVDVVLAAHNFGQDPAFMARLKSRFSFLSIQDGLVRAVS